MTIISNKLPIPFKADFLVMMPELFGNAEVGMKWRLKNRPYGYSVILNTHKPSEQTLEATKQTLCRRFWRSIGAA